MSDHHAQFTSYQSGGPHPTIAGNILDPSVNADGAKNQRGVGGTDESTIKDEAREHMVGGNSTGHGHSHGSSGLGGSSSGTGGSSNLGQGSSGYDNQSGLREDLSNTSSYGQGQDQGFDDRSSTGRSGFNEPSATHQHNSGIEHIRGASGLDREAGRSSGLDSNTGVASGVSSGATGVGHSETGYGSSNTTASGYGSSNTGYGSSTAGPHSSNLANKADPRVDSDLSSTRNTNSGYGSGAATGAGAGALAGAGAAAYGEHSRDERGTLDAAGNNNSSISPSNHHHSSTSGYGSSNNTTSGSTGYDSSNTSSGIGYGADNTTSGTGLGRDAATRGSTTVADNTSSTSQLDQGTAGSGNDIIDSSRTGTTGGTHHASAPGAGAAGGAGTTAADKSSGPPPNIPTAGGERIGTKHWGESKVIPDNPPRRESATGAGVSSSAGQPDDLTKSNTASNVGSATKPGSITGETGKESVVDKIKDKLHIGHK